VQYHVARVLLVRTRAEMLVFSCWICATLLMSHVIFSLVPLHAAFVVFGGDL
jgi:hypothetical protein